MAHSKGGQIQILLHCPAPVGGPRPVAGASGRTGELNTEIWAGITRAVGLAEGGSYSLIQKKSLPGLGGRAAVFAEPSVPEGPAVEAGLSEGSPF